MGVIITTSGGVPILYRELSPLIGLTGKENKALLVSSIISAMISFASETLKTDLKVMVINNLILHIVKSERFIVCFIDQIKNESYYEIGKKVIKILYKMGIEDAVVLSDEESESLWEKIKDILGEYPNPIKLLKDYYDKINTFIEKGTTTVKIELGSLLEDKTYTPALTILVKNEIKAKVKKIGDFESLLDSFMNWEFEKAFEGSLAYFKGVNYDYVKVLNANSALMLREIDPFRKAPSLEYIQRVISSIDDELLRKINELKFNLYMDIMFYPKYAKFVLDNKDEIMDKLEKRDSESKIYLISLLSLTRISYRILKSKMDYINELSPKFYWSLLYERYMEESTKTFDKFVDGLANLKLEEERMGENKKIEKLLVTLSRLSYLRNMFRAFPISYDEMKEILEVEMGNLPVILDNLENIEIPLTLKVNAMSNLFELALLVYRHISPAKSKKIVGKLYKSVAKYLSKLYSYRNTKRIILSTYHNTIPRLLGIIFYGLAKRCYVPINLFKLFGEDINENLEAVYSYTKTRYKMSFISALFILQLMADKIRIGAVRRNLLTRISSTMESISRGLNLDDPERFFSILYTVESYYLSDDPKLQIVAESLINRVKNEEPEHLYMILENIKRSYIKG